MAEILKPFRINVDLCRSLSYEEFELVEGDNGNVLYILLTNDNVPVDLTGAIVRPTFAHSKSTWQQDSSVVDGGVTVGTGVGKNEITIRLKSESYAPAGTTLCELPIYSGDGNETLVTTQYFAFTAHRSMTNDQTIQSQEKYPILVELIRLCNALLAREQSNYAETDTFDPTYIKNKPVVGTNVQDATQNLTAETTLADADTVPFYDASASAHRKTTWSNLVKKIFGSITGLVKADGAGNISAAVANTDYAAAAHASRHAAGAADAISGYATVDANTKVTAAQASAYVNTQTDSYTLVLADAGGRVHMNKSTANNLTVPPNSDVAFPVGTEIEIKQIGAGQTTIVAGAGVTLRNADTALKIEKQWCSAALIKLATDEWCVDGRTVA